MLLFIVVVVLMLLSLVDPIRFNPTDPHLIVGGCANGQLVLWNIEEHQDCLQVNKTTDMLESRATAANKVSGMIMCQDVVVGCLAHWGVSRNAVNAKAIPIN